MFVHQKVGESVSAEVALMGTWFRLRQEKDKRNGEGGRAKVSKRSSFDMVNEQVLI